MLKDWCMSDLCASFFDVREFSILWVVFRGERMEIGSVNHF